MMNSTNWGQALTLSLKAGWTDEKVAEQLTGVVEALDRLADVFVPEVAESFLFGSNSFLEGARPIDVLWYGKTQEVLDAIEAQVSLAYA